MDAVRTDALSEVFLLVTHYTPTITGDVSSYKGNLNSNTSPLSTKNSLGALGFE